MTLKTPVGFQLDSQLLYERQKATRAAQAQVGPIIVAVGLQVPENIGSVLRLADAAGSAKAIFLDSGASATALKRIRRMARNADALVKWEFLTVENFSEQIDSYPPLIALELTTGSTSIFAAALPNPCALVVGSERFGVPETLLAKCQRAVHIPMYGVNGSMNVTHALAIALFEWRRQHGVVYLKRETSGENEV